MSAASKAKLSEMLTDVNHPFARNLNELHISATFDTGPDGNIENQIHKLIIEAADTFGSASDIDGIICPDYGPAAFILGRGLSYHRPLTGPFDPKLIVISDNGKMPRQFVPTQLL